MRVVSPIEHSSLRDILGAQGFFAVVHCSALFVVFLFFQRYSSNNFIRQLPVPEGGGLVVPGFVSTGDAPFGNRRRRGTLTGARPEPAQTWIRSLVSRFSNIRKLRNTYLKLTSILSTTKKP